MPESFHVTSEEAPAPTDMAAVRAGLEAFNRLHAAADGYRPLNLFVRDSRGSVAGGLLGATYWSWLYVEILWVSEPARGQGYGRRLLDLAEQEARTRGCYAAHLDTLSFQALPFYERHGYRIYGVLDDLPRGHKRYFLQKALGPRE
jgi:GNAT superfamily N-acetyltransferase